MATPSDQCAVAADGRLLDASEIIFYNDPDDDTPLPSLNSDTTSTHPSLHPFFQGGPAPSEMAAGSRRSLCVSRPSARITDPNNMEASGSTAICKRSATVTISAEGSQHAARRPKLTSSDDESEQDNGLDSAEVGVEDDSDEAGDATTEEEGVDNSTDIEHAEEAYHTTKAMGDADRQVCLIHLKPLVRSNTW